MLTHHTGEEPGGEVDCAAAEPSAPEVDRAAGEPGVPEADRATGELGAPEADRAAGGRAVVSSGEFASFRQRNLTTSGVMWATCHQGCGWNR